MKHNRLVKWILGIASVASLVVCIAISIAVFQGILDAGPFKSIFLIATLVWFVSATTWSLIRPQST